MRLEEANTSTTKPPAQPTFQWLHTMASHLKGSYILHVFFYFRILPPLLQVRALCFSRKQQERFYEAGGGGCWQQFLKEKKFEKSEILTVLYPRIKFSRTERSRTACDEEKSFSRPTFAGKIRIHGSDRVKVWFMDHTIRTEGFALLGIRWDWLETISLSLPIFTDDTNLPQIKLATSKTSAAQAAMLGVLTCSSSNWYFNC